MLQSIRPRVPSPALVVSLLALVLAMGGLGMAAIPDGSGTIHGCYKKKKGTLRLVSSGAKCKKSERSISWNQKGQPGAAGAKGETGAAGIAGAAGAAATKLFAHVTNSGTLSSVSQGATAASHPGTGSYTVTFNRDLTGCVASAGVGFVAGVGGSLNTNTVARTSISNSTPENVTVGLRDPNANANVDGNFNVIVFC